MFRLPRITSPLRPTIETKRATSHSRLGVVCRPVRRRRLGSAPTVMLAVTLAAVLSISIAMAAAPAVHAAGLQTDSASATTLATTEAAAEVAALTSLTYQRGYSLQNGWLCLGWWTSPSEATAAAAATGAPVTSLITYVYHCTQRWHRDRAGTYISDNPVWVPNAFLNAQNVLCLRWLAPQTTQTMQTTQTTQPSNSPQSEPQSGQAQTRTSYESPAHCTQHWQRDSSGALISRNPAWVPSAAAAAVLVLTTTNAPAATSTPSPSPHPGSSQTPPPNWTPPAQAGAQPGTAAIVSEIRQVFGAFANQALQVATCESGLDPSAVNSIAVGNSHAVGVFQILYPSTWDTTSYRSLSPLNAHDNIHAAYEIFTRDGHTWREWVCQPHS